GRRAGGVETYLSPNCCHSARNFCGGSAPGPRPLRGLRPRTPGYFLYGQKLTKKPHRGGTLSMGSRSYVPHPRDDTKGATPPLDSPPGLLLVQLFFGYSRGCNTRTMVRFLTLRTMILFIGLEPSLSLI